MFPQALALVIPEHGGAFRRVEPSDYLGALPETRVEQREDGGTAVVFLLVFTLGLGQLIECGPLR